MSNFYTKLVAAAAALAISACVVSAQTTAPAPAPATPAPKAATTAPTTPPKKAFVPKKATTPAGIKCSADADAKGLHGKERRKFRSTCIREFKKAEAPKKT
jgi:hypothetical protein